jgi:hypothetical protein
MRVVSWRSRRALAMYGAVVASTAAFLSLPTTARTESACEVLREWARPYQGASVTYDEFARFDRPHRLAIFNAVSPDIRAALVQEQLRRFSQRPDLNAPQRASIAEAMTLTTAALYERQPAAIQKHREFWSRTDQLFTSIEQRRPWFDIGNVNVAPAIALENAGLSRKAVAFGFCQCATDWDCFGGACGGGGGCTTWQGCGPQGFQYCGGMCF